MIESSWIPISKQDFFTSRKKKRTRMETKLLHLLAELCDANGLVASERFYQDESTGKPVLVFEAKEGNIPIVQEPGISYTKIARPAAKRIASYIFGKIDAAVYRTSRLSFNITEAVSKLKKRRKKNVECK